MRATTGAGAFFRASAIPMAIFTMKECSAVSVHIHPNAAETIFVLAGEDAWRPRVLLGMRKMFCLPQPHTH
jgi:uncharacterized RmlC-like cupin family protein